MINKMAFRTDKEHSKWDQIQKAGSTPIEKILKGEATSSDIKALGDLIAKQHTEASKVFEAGIQGAEATADAIIDKMNKERIEIGKRPLTQKSQERLFKQTFQRVLSASAEDIIGSIHDLIDEKFDDLGEELTTSNKSLIEAAFEKLANLKLAKKDEEKKTDNSLDRGSAYSVWRKSARPQSLPDDAVPSIVDKVVALTAKVDEVQKTADKTLKHAEEADDLGEELSDPSPSPTIGPATSLIGKLRDKLLKKRSYFDRDDDQFHNMQSLLAKYGAKKDKDVKSDVKAAYLADPSLNSKFPLKIAIAHALKQNSDARRKAEDHWKELKADYNGDNDDKNANSWLRRLKGMFGFGKKDRDRDGLGGGWVKNLGKVLLLTLLNPEILTTVSKMIAKYLNFDTISDFVASSWKEIKEGGSKTMDWIIEKIQNFFHPNTKAAVPKTSEDVAKVTASVQKESAIPANATPASAATAVRDLEPRIEQTKRKLAAAQAAAAKNPSSDNQMVVSHLSQRLAILQNQLAAYKTKIPGGSTYGATPTQVTANVGTGTNGGVVPMPDNTVGKFQKPGKSSTVGGEQIPTTRANAMSSASSVDPQTILNNSSARPQVQSASPLNFKDGVIVPPADSSTQGGGGQSPSSSTTSTSTVSISSFGFGSGDDTLNILNMGLMA